jgi:F0F1-type ATP synthase delta subunit
MSELQTTARPYAKALFKSAKENNALDKNFDMLKNLKVILCDENIKAIVSNDSFDNKYKVSLLTGVLEESFDENFVRFISLLAGK